MPTDRGLFRYAARQGPPSYPGYSSGGTSVAQLLMMRGQQQADAAQQQGQIWQNAFQDIGQQLAGGFAKAAEDKKLKKRDAAWLSVVNDPELMKDPRRAYAKAVEIWGPEDGPKQFQGLAAAHQLGQPNRNPEADHKALVSIGGAMSKMSDGGRAAIWPQAKALTARAFPELAKSLPDQYDPQVWTSTVGPLLDSMQPAGKTPEGFTLSPGQQRFGPDGKPLAAVPPEAKEGAGFSLGPGETRYDASGNPIASRPAAPREPRQDNEPLVPVMGDDGQAVLMRRSRAEGRRPASNREQGRPVLSGDANRLADFDTSLDDLGTLREQITGSGATGASAKVGAMLPNVVTEFTGLGADAKAKQATIDRVKQVIGKTLEGGVLRKEDEAKYEKILPTISDPPSVVKAKLEGLDAAIKLRKERLVESLGSAGFDTAGFQGGGAPRRPTGGGSRPRATNPQTGQVVEFDGKAWVPVK